MDDSTQKRVNALIHQVAVLDRKVDFLLQHLGLTFIDDRPPPNDYERLILDGDLIGAIGLLRTRERLSLADAKRVIEGMAAKLGVPTG